MGIRLFHGARVAAVVLAAGCSRNDDTVHFGSDTGGTAGTDGAASGGGPTGGITGSNGGRVNGAGGSVVGAGGSNAGGSNAGDSNAGGAGGKGGGGSGGKSNGGTSGAGGSGTGGSAGTGGAPVITPYKSTAKQIATKLGRDHFLIGMGNDLNGDHYQDAAYTFGVTMDVHYAYLVGLKGKGGWTDWNAGGSFADELIKPAMAKGVVPMFTLYSMAAQGQGNKAALTDDGYMRPYWDGAKLLFQRLAPFGVPVLVNFEPDWWGFAQQASGNNPASMKAHVGSLAPDCAGLAEDVAGMGKCLLVLARKYAPKALIGFHVSSWADGDPQKIITFMKALGADAGDFLTTDTLDRDAGCFEAHTDPNCQRDGTFYWDETNQTSPNFHEHLAWVKTITDGLGKPMLWWQTPFGVPSDVAGGTSGHYRDNRVKYVFEHASEFAAVNGLGVLFGTGTGNQTDWTTDGDQFKNAVTTYFASPTPIP